MEWRRVSGGTAKEQNSLHGTFDEPSTSGEHRRLSPDELLQGLLVKLAMTEP
jgi:hypothetical protein